MVPRDTAAPSRRQPRGPPRARRAPSAAPAADADTLSALLFVAGEPVRRDDLLAATGWTPPRVQAALDALMAEPPRGLTIQADGDRLCLVTCGAVSGPVERLLGRLGRSERLEPVDLPETAWFVLGIVVLEQPITRAEVTVRRLADSDRQVQVLLQHRLIREEPRAALPGRGIPLVTTDLLLRRFGVTSLGELQQRILAQPPEAPPA